ncbi:MAG: short-chain dehydrogenase [Deltaproteobacteria bacterium]|nr:short-chain dehydrogenase [Deltaproteobacteria bacterium]
MGQLDGLAAVIGGSSRGIGRAVAQAMASEGASVVVNGRSAAGVDQVVAEIRESGAAVTGYAGSVADFETARSLIECCRDSFGRVDILVNCAGTAEPPRSSILNLRPEAWRELIDSHLTGTFNTCRHAAPLMAERGSGSIINTSSHSYLGHYAGTGYPAAKGGVNSLTFAMAAELEEHGVRVNAVCPGARTRLSTGAEYEDRIRELSARGIMSDAVRDASLAPHEPEHVGPLYALLASPAARGVTGRLFSASGGYVGLHQSGREIPLAYRDVNEGAWPLRLLGEAVIPSLLS